MMWKRIFFSKIFILIEIIGLIFAGLSLFKILDKKQQRTAEMDKLKEQLLVLKNQNSDFLTKLQEIQTDSYVELEAKKRLNLKRPGEKVVVFVKEPAESQPIAIAEKTIDNISQSNLKMWWQYFFDN